MAARRVATLAALILLASGSSAFPQLRTLETKELRLVYVDPTLAYLAPHAARSFESALSFEKSLFHYEPWEPVTVTLLDLSDVGRASATALPRNNVTIQVEPPSFVYETFAPNERVNTYMNHELVHVVAMDQAAGSDRAARKFFRGKVLVTPDHPETIGYLYLTVPRLAVPSWYHEGLAVFFETWMAGGIGRAQGSYDEMVFRSMVRDGAEFYDPLGLVSEAIRVDFQIGANSYLYGTRFLSYLALQHGPQSVMDWMLRREGTKKYYAAQFEQVYGRPLAQGWEEWIAWEKEFQSANLAAIRRYPTTPYRDLSPKALGSVSRAFVDPERRRLYGAFIYPGAVAHIGAISLDDGSVDPIVEVKDPILYSVTSLAFDPEGKTLFYTTDNSAYRDLRTVDPVTKRARTLIKDARIGDLVFDRRDRSLWGIRQLNGLSTLVRVRPPYDTWNQIHTFAFGQIPYDLDLSPDGSLLSLSLGEVSGRHSLRVFRLDAVLAGDLKPLHEVDFGSTIPCNFVFSPDGKYLYGSSYYTGVSNIFRYDLATEKLDAVTNTETGMFRPIPQAADSLIVFRYSGQGFVPAEIQAAPLEDVSAITFLGQRIAEEHPVVRGYMAGSPADVPLDERITRQRSYPSFRGIRLESVYPIVEGYKNSFALGAAAHFSDPISLNRTSVSVSYSPDSDLPSEERLHALVRYRRYDWRVDLKWNSADFYDLFGPTKTGRKGYGIDLGHKSTLLYDVPRELSLDLDGQFSAGLDRLPYAQNIEATYDRLATGTARLVYSNQRASLGAVENEKGILTEALVGANYVHGDLIRFGRLRLDLGFPLPWDHSALWLRSSGGASSGAPEDVFANFYFGAFGNNWVDHGSIKRYHEPYAFPGLEINEVGGKTYVKTLLEWNLPPWIFRHVGKPGFHLAWSRASLFATGIETNPGNASLARRVGDLGTQVDFRFSALSQLDLTLSAGYAIAFEQGADRRGEAMISLKILR